MFYTIDNFLTPDDLRKLHIIYDNEASFASGKYGNAENKIVKDNLVMEHGEPYYKCSDIVKNELMMNSELVHYTSLKRTSEFTFTEFREGHFYDSHIDAYYMENYVRTDLSCTIFLSDPSEYEGGELSINIGNREVDYKLPAGSLLLYPTNEYHRVRQITSGKRRVCIFWIESHICDPTVRQALGELSRVFFDDGVGLNSADEIKKVIQKPIFSLKKQFSTLS